MKRCLAARPADYVDTSIYLCAFEERRWPFLRLFLARYGGRGGVESPCCTCAAGRRHCGGVGLVSVRSGRKTWRGENSTSEEEVVIDVLVNDASTVDKRVALADELEHGRQFLDGEIGFSMQDGKSLHTGYDIGDEIKSQQASVDASNGLGIPLSEMQKNFVNRTSDKGFIDQWYPAISSRTENRYGTGSYNPNATPEEVKAFYIDKGRRERVVYRQVGKNVIIKK